MGLIRRRGIGSRAERSSVYDSAYTLWLLNETSGSRVDSIGSNHLTDNNTVMSASKGSPAPANIPETVAYFVTGNSEFLSKLGMVLNLDAGYTISYWVNIIDRPVGENVADTIFEKTTGWDNKKQMFGNTASVDSTSRWYHTSGIQNGAGTLQMNAYGYTQNLPGNANVGKWLHCVQVYDLNDATNMYRAWLNNVELTQHSWANWALPQTLNTTCDFLLNKSYAGPVYGRTKMMSTFAIFGSAFNAAQRALLWNGGDGASLAGYV